MNFLQVVSVFKRHFNSQGHIMAVGDAIVFPGFLTPVLTQLSFQLFFSHAIPTTVLTCFSRGERRKYAGKKGLLKRVSNSQPPGHESDTLTTEPPGHGEFLARSFVVSFYHNPDFNYHKEQGCSINPFPNKRLFYMSVVQIF